MEKTRTSWCRRAIAFALAASILFVGCAQTCRINSDPEGGKIYVNGIYVGESPTVYRYRSGLPETYIVEIRKDGYKPLVNVTIDRTLRADVSLLLLLLAIVPYFFSARLEDQYVFPLEKLAEAAP
ncbi:MAG: PEGA domain-containing protein [Planctomycetota bacterium]